MKEVVPNFYAVIPADVRYCDDLPANAKLLYGEISALCNQNGFCWADNNYFSNLYKVNTTAISRWISALRMAGFIRVEVYPELGNERKIFLEFSGPEVLSKKTRGVLSKKTRGSCAKRQEGLVQKDKPYKENNTINNTENRESGALAFFEAEMPSKYEVFLMHHRKQFSDDEFLSFTQKFNATVEMEIDQRRMEWTAKQIEHRLTKFVLNYIEIKNRDTKKQSFVQPAADSKPARTIFKG